MQKNTHTHILTQRKSERETNRNSKQGREIEVQIEHRVGEMKKDRQTK